MELVRYHTQHYLPIPTVPTLAIPKEPSRDTIPRETPGYTSNTWMEWYWGSPGLIPHGSTV